MHNYFLTFSLLAGIIVNMLGGPRPASAATIYEQ
jgi:hypothetical protein